MIELYDALHELRNVPEPPERIISLSPAVTEILFELGLGDKIIGISAFCARPPETKNIRKIGSYGSVRPELLEELKPDLIVMVSGYQNEFAKNLSKKFPVYVFELPSSVGGILDLVSKVGVVTNKMDEARYLNFELSKYLGSMRRHMSIRGYIEIDLAEPVTFGALSYITDALSMLGVKTLYRNIYKEWISPNFNDVVEYDPEVIFYEAKMYSSFNEENLRRLIDARGWQKLSAAKNESIFLTPGKLDFFAHHGPSFIRQVIPWAMERLDLVGL